MPPPPPLLLLFGTTPEGHPLRRVLPPLLGALFALAWMNAPLARGAAPATPSRLFSTTTPSQHVWPVHLTISADEWKKMQPTRGAFAKQPPAADKNPDRKPRGGFGYDFEYVKAAVTIDGFQLPSDVAVRFKGNSTYAVAANTLKRPLKIDLDRFDPEQTFRGLRKLVLNNAVLDTNHTRETLGFAMYRAAGVPAPRTSFAMLTLTVPGKYDREVVGVYTLIEAVDKAFLEDRFGSKKGLLIKPERIGPLDYLGDDWKAYESRYRPKSTATPRTQERLMDLIRLVQHADEKRFNKEIGKLLDVDEFLRYLAATVALSSLDSFIGFAHNYYLYLNPKTDRFVIVPWDLDHSFGALTMLGSAQQLMELSIRRPQLGRNPLVERLLGNEKTFSAYRKHLQKLLDTSFKADGLKKQAGAIQKLLAPFKEQEKKAMQKRGDSWSLWTLGLLIGKPTELETFIPKRIASLEQQLAGKSTGQTLTQRGPFGGPQAQALVRPIMQAADKDKDRKLSKDEAAAAVKALFAACDEGKKGKLNQPQLAAGLEKLMPRKPATTGLAAGLARAIVDHAGTDGRVDEKALLTAAEKLFGKVDRNKDGLLDERELTEGLRQLLATPFVAAGPR